MALAWTPGYLCSPGGKAWSQTNTTGPHGSEIDLNLDSWWGWGVILEFICMVHLMHGEKYCLEFSILPKFGWRSDKGFLGEYRSQRPKEWSSRILFANLGSQGCVRRSTADYYRLRTKDGTWCAHQGL